MSINFAHTILFERILSTQFKMSHFKYSVIMEKDMSRIPNEEEQGTRAYDYAHGILGGLFHGQAFKHSGATIIVGRDYFGE